MKMKEIDKNEEIKAKECIHRTKKPEIDKKRNYKLTKDPKIQ